MQQRECQLYEAREQMKNREVLLGVEGGTENANLLFGGVFLILRFVFIKGNIIHRLTKILSRFFIRYRLLPDRMSAITSSIKPFNAPLPFSLVRHAFSSVSPRHHHPKVYQRYVQYEHANIYRPSPSCVFSSLVSVLPLRLPRQPSWSSFSMLLWSSFWAYPPRHPLVHH